MDSLNAVDVGIVTVVGLLAVLGMRRGLLLGILDLVGVAAALVAAALFYRRFIGPLEDLGLARLTAAVVSFAGVNIVAQAVVSVVTAAVLRPLVRPRWPRLLRWSDGLLGVVPGALKGLAIAAVVVVPLAFLQRPVVLSEQVRESRLADPLVGVGLDVLYGAVERYDVDLADFAAITTRPEEGSVELPFKVTSGLEVDEELERAMLRLVNEERAAAGLEPVELDIELREVGRAHADEMFRMGYFAHESPVTGTPADRLNEADVLYLSSGENLAYAPSLEVAHEGLMNSPGHRANILSPVFTRLGVGVVRSARRGIMFTQEFAA